MYRTRLLNFRDAWMKVSANWRMCRAIPTEANTISKRIKSSLKRLKQSKLDLVSLCRRKSESWINSARTTQSSLTEPSGVSYTWSSVDQSLEFDPNSCITSSRYKTTNLCFGEHDPSQSLRLQSFGSQYYQCSSWISSPITWARGDSRHNQPSPRQPTNDSRKKLRR
jgi:hypothetical protein